MPNSFPDIHTTGAVHHWVQARWMPEPYYLGTAEISPQVLMRQYYSEVMAPAAGSVLPFQREYEGQAATVSVLFTRWSKFAEFGLMVNGANTVYSTQFTTASGGTTGTGSIPASEGSGGGNYGLPGTLVTTGDFGDGGDFGSSGSFSGDGYQLPNSDVDPNDPFFNPPAVPSGGFTSIYENVPPLGPGTLTTDNVAGPGGNLESFFGPLPGGALQTSQGSVPNPLSYVTMGAVVGSETRWSRGSLAFGNRDFRLWQVFDFAGWGRLQSRGLEIGRYWPQVTLERHGIIAAGTQGKKMLLVFDCQPQFNNESTPGGIPVPGNNERGWRLWSINPATFPPSVLVPQ